MKHTHSKPFTPLAKLTSLAVLIPSFLVFGIGSAGLTFLDATAAHASDDSDSQTCSVIHLMSGTNTKTAGWTATNPSGSPLTIGQYSPGTLVAASVTTPVIPPWVDPAVDAHFATTGALWVSSNASWPGGAGNTEGSASSSEWRLFEDSFTLPVGAVVSSAHVDYTGDNAVAMYLNGSQVSTTNLTPTDYVFGPQATDTPNTFGMVTEKNITPVAAMNTLDFVVRNMGGDYTSNPTGLVYHASIAYCVPNIEEHNDVKVTILKYLDGVMATASSTNGASFPMSATWNATNTGSGTGSYDLAAAGFNGDPTPYQAITSPMTNGASYSTNEVTGGAVVGALCTTGQPFALQGYAVGPTLAAAQAAAMATTAPSFTNLHHDEFVIVKDMSCVGNPTYSSSTGAIGGNVGGGVSNDVPLVVTSIDRIQTDATADDSYVHGWKYVFHITAPMSEPKLAMKFADWMNTIPTSTLATANNVRISSLQANNGGATIVLTAANTYSVPDLQMVSDLSTSTPGRQVEITVEVKIPATTVNGAYTTNYGVRSLN